MIPAQFGLFIAGSTPADARGYRGKEIDEWLKAHVDEVESFVILDDDNDMKPWGSHLVKTSAKSYSSSKKDFE